MATGTTSDITTASCPAPEGSRSTGSPAAATASANRVVSDASQGTAG